jgi:hypothetical protein
VARCTDCERQDSNQLIDPPIPGGYKGAKHHKRKTNNSIKKCEPESFYKLRDLFEKVGIVHLGAINMIKRDIRP